MVFHIYDSILFRDWYDILQSDFIFLCQFKNWDHNFYTCSFQSEALEFGKTTFTSSQQLNFQTAFAAYIYFSFNWPAFPYQRKLFPKSIKHRMPNYICFKFIFQETASLWITSS